MERRTELVKYGMETNHFDSFICSILSNVVSEIIGGQD